ncbi:MAG TPA: energy transducer TonB [Flavobacteriales bacterium]|nr:energy transducer TonB [Flavobacteriales bacterium]
MKHDFIFHNRQVFFDFQCNENFEALPAASTGKYCGACNKTIVDFTGFTGDEIFTYLKSRPKGTVCGYFKPQQVQDDVVVNFEDAYEKLDFTKRFVFILLFVFGTSLFAIQLAHAPLNHSPQTVQAVKQHHDLKPQATQLLKAGFEKINLVKTPGAKKITEIQTVVEEWDPPQLGGYPSYTIPVAPTHEPQQPLTETEIVYTETMPAFNGGGWRLNQYLSQNIRYPQYAIANKLQGKVYVEFIVEANGKVTSPKVLKTPDESLSQEAIRVLLNMPLWEPATFKGRNVASRYVLPVNFKLQ